MSSLVTWLRGGGSPATPSTSNNNATRSPQGADGEERAPSPIHKNRDDVEPVEDQGALEISPDEADEVLSESNQSLVLQLIKSGQLVIGLDLTKVVLPTFILEPRSLLEKLSDFWMHPQLFADLNCEDPIEGYNADVSRMLRVVRWYLSGFHVRPRGVKKPYNPILGEQFECDIQVPKLSGDGSNGPSCNNNNVWFTAEQVSHHPPVTAFYVRSGSVSMHGNYYPRSKFLGNSAASIGEGISTILFDDGQAYTCTWPTVYVRGVVFGRLLMELGGKVEIVCAQSGIQADLDFKVKGFWRGEYNGVRGGIFYQSKGYNNPDVILGGHWNGVVTHHPGKDKKAVQTLLDVRSLALGERKATNTTGIPEEAFSQNVWSKVTAALSSNDVEAATREKNVVEQQQRCVRNDLHSRGDVHQHRHFTDLHRGDGPRNYCKMNWVYTGPNAQPHSYIDNLVDEAEASLS